MTNFFDIEIEFSEERLQLAQRDPLARQHYVALFGISSC